MPKAHELFLNVLRVILRAICPSCLIGGGGVKNGLLLGETDPTGEKKMPTDPIEVADLYATVLHTLGIDYAKEVITPIGRPMKYCSGTPIERLM